VGDNPWLTMLEDLIRTFETGTGTALTAFEVPGKVGRLPNALGGDPKQWSLLAAPAKSKQGFFKLLRAKAHFLMLPKTIVETMQKSSRMLSVTEDHPDPPGAAGETVNGVSPRTAEMRIPGAFDGLVKVGYDLGHDSVGLSPYALLATIYHELTHACLWLYEDFDAEFQTFRSKGVVDYLRAEGVDGTPLDPARAFSEAAAYYVDDRIRCWCLALNALDSMLRHKPKVPDDLFQSEMRAVVQDYYKVQPIYGTVYKDGKFVDIRSPALSDELRDAINEKILDGLPLTKPFAETPLAGLYDKLKEP
jgi:hypothetical protein